MMHPFAAIPTVLALLAAPVIAAPGRPGQTPATDYVLARAADAGGDPARALAGYRAVDAAAMGTPLEARIYRQAIAGGDEKAVVAAARTLASRPDTPPDARLVLVADAARSRDWAGARAAIAAIPDGDVFGFLVPILSAWIARGEGGDPFPALAAGRGGTLAQPYIAEHRALLSLATGRRAEGITALRAVTTGGGARVVRLRIAGAAMLTGTDRATALDLLAGDDPALVRARAIVAAGRRLPGAVDTPAEGIAELLLRVAADLNRDRITPLALALARAATFAAPDNAEGWLVAANLLAAAGLDTQGLAAAARVSPADPFAAAARDVRLRILLRAGRKEEALADALAATRGADAGRADWGRLGDVRSALGQHREAAGAYGRAADLVARDPAEARMTGQLRMLQGGALEQAGDWPAARRTLEQAVALAPEDAVALNYLGYAKLERDEDIPAATALIERASRLAPDDSAITDSLGWAYFRQGRVAAAIPVLEKAVRGEPGDPAINEHLGDAYWAAGRRQEARYAWRAAAVYAGDADRTRIAGKIDAGPAR